MIFPPSGFCTYNLAEIRVTLMEKSTAFVLANVTNKAATEVSNSLLAMWPIMPLNIGVPSWSTDTLLPQTPGVGLKMYLPVDQVRDT